MIKFMGRTSVKRTSLSLVRLLVAIGVMLPGITAAQIAFTKGATYPTVTYPVVVIMVDLNDDGRLDSVIARDPPSVGILMAQNEGTFGPIMSVAAGAYPVGLISGDFNGDYQTDLAAAISDNAISIFPGVGDGNFLAPLNLSYNASPSSIASSDIDADGVLDVVTTNRAGPDISIFKGNGDGTFQEPKSLFLNGPPWNAIPEGLAFVDLNHDEIQDLVVANGNGSAVTVLLGYPNGLFGQFTLMIAPGWYTTSVAAADLDEDGNPDIIVGNWDTTISVFLGNGEGNFGAPITYSTGPAITGGETNLATSDFNGDGHVDLAVSLGNEFRISFFEGRGDGSFHDVYNIPISEERSGANSIALADIDGNGRMDVLYVEGGQFGMDPKLSTLMNDIIFISNFSGGQVD